jgi:hypothetical protein
MKRDKDLLRKYIDLVHSVIVVIERDMTISLVNKNCTDLLGYSEKEIIGKNWFDLVIPKRDRSQVKYIFKQLIDGEIEAREWHENSILTRSGEERLIRWHNSVYTDENGKILATVSSGEDMTEMMKSQIALKESEHKYRILASMISDYIYTARIDDVNIKTDWVLSLSSG